MDNSYDPMGEIMELLTEIKENDVLIDTAIGHMAPTLANVVRVMEFAKDKAHNDGIMEVMPCSDIEDYVDRAPTVAAVHEEKFIDNWRLFFSKIYVSEVPRATIAEAMRVTNSYYTMRIT